MPLLAAAMSLAALVVHVRAAALTGQPLELFLADAWVGLLYPAAGAWLFSRGRATGAAVVMLTASLLAAAGLSLAWATFDAADGALGAGGTVAAWLATWTWVPYLLLPTALPVLYAAPLARRTSGRWLVRSAVVLAGVVAVLSAVAPGPVSDGAGVHNPWGVEAWSGWMEPLAALPGVALLVLAPLAVVLLVLAWLRGSGPGVRAAAVGAAAFTVAALTAGALPYPWSDVWTAAGATVLPVAMLVDQRWSDLRAEQETARRSMVLARDAERDRLRQDLHDGVAPHLAGLALRVDGIRPASSPEVAEQLEGVGDALRDAVHEVRRIVDGLAPLAVDQLGLVGAVRAAADQVSPGDVVVEAQELPPLSAPVEVAAYRIVLEAIGNTVRHSRASTVRVHLGADEEGDLRVRVTDNGVGGARARPDGLGLAGMAARAEALGGRVDVREGRPHGTVVEAVLPGERP